MTGYFASVFAKSKYKKKREKGIQATDYSKSYKTKTEARAEARRKIRSDKKTNPHSKHLKYSAHVVTRI